MSRRVGTCWPHNGQLALRVLAVELILNRHPAAPHGWGPAAWRHPWDLVARRLTLPEWVVSTMRTSSGPNSMTRGVDRWGVVGGTRQRPVVASWRSMGSIRGSVTCPDWPSIVGSGVRRPATYAATASPALASSSLTGSPPQSACRHPLSGAVAPLQTEGPVHPGEHLDTERQSEQPGLLYCPDPLIVLSIHRYDGRGKGFLRRSLPGPGRAAALVDVPGRTAPAGISSGQGTFLVEPRHPSRWRGRHPTRRP
jgi:hypothetical protein